MEWCSCGLVIMEDMTNAAVLAVAGGVALLTAVVWGLTLGVRQWEAAARWRRATRHHDDLRAEIQHRYESVYSAIAQQQNFSPAQQEKLRWVFGQIDQVLERRRAQDLAAIHPLRVSGRWVLGPVLLAAAGAGFVVAAALVQP